MEQNAKKALSIADRAYVLETGKIVLDGKADVLLNDDSIKRHIWVSRRIAMDKKVIITIARQYGSGGKTIGQMLAKVLGINATPGNFKNGFR